jgi:hypothetical protein
MVAVFAVDPGAVYTGVAMIWEDGSYGAKQFFDPVEAFEWLTGYYYNGDVVLIEDYTHGGIFTKEAKETLRVQGLFEYGIRWKLGVTPIIRNKSQRLSGVSEATEKVQDANPDLTLPMTKDAISALAHIITYKRSGYGRPTASGEANS